MFVGDDVLLERDPHNSYDSCAIKVLRNWDVQIGHLPSGLAAVLAPYMDAGELELEGTVTEDDERPDWSTRDLDLDLYCSEAVGAQIEAELGRSVKRAGATTKST